jgi:RNA polymerase sigma-70 factor (ECF subfamily)
MNDTLQTYTDEKLFKELCSGNREAAFKEIYVRYSSRVYLYCQKVLGKGTLADDVYQETFLNFLKSAHEERDTTHLLGYLLKIARNNCLKVRRRQTFKNVTFEDFHFPVDDAAFEQEELCRLVTSALDLLIEEHREALVLQMYSGLSYQEIAELTGVPLTTVRNRIARAKSKIREILTPYIEGNR